MCVRKLRRGFKSSKLNFKILHQLPIHDRPKPLTLFSKRAKTASDAMSLGEGGFDCDVIHVGIKVEICSCPCTLLINGYSCFRSFLVASEAPRYLNNSVSFFSLFLRRNLIDN